MIIISRAVEKVARRFVSNTLRNIPAEFALLKACCRWPPSAERDAGIRDAIKEGIRWSRFIKIVNHHRVWSLVRDGLGRAQTTLPPEIDSTLRFRQATIARQNLLMAADVVRIQRAFSQARLKLMFLKGQTLCLLAYGDLSLKHTLDIDILVAPADVRAAHNVLEELGYRATRPLRDLPDYRLGLLIAAGKELVMINDENGLMLELHWKLAYNRFLLKSIDVRSEAQLVHIGSTSVSTLNHEELFVYLCAHGAQHAWARLKWLADAAALLTSSSPDTIVRLYRRAQNEGAGLCAGQCLLLSKHLLGLEIPQQLDQELRSCGTIQILQCVGLATLVSEVGENEAEGQTLSNWRILLLLFFIGRGWRYRIEELARYLVSPEDVLMIPLPRWLGWVYVALRIPFWIWRKIYGLSAAKMAATELPSHDGPNGAAS